MGVNPTTSISHKNEEEERKRRRQKKEEEVQRVAANYQVDYVIRITKSTQTFMNI
jgi:hypothetical protein